MAHIHKKIKKGKAYFYYREVGRVHGKTKVLNQVYLGTAEKIKDLVTTNKNAEVKRLQVQDFGALWVANQIDERVGLVKLIDSLLPRRFKGTSLGEFFLYAAFNRMIDSKSKRALPEWYDPTAIQFIRPVDLKSLDSHGYHRKWSSVTEEDLQTVAKAFFDKITAAQAQGDGCFLFDTTNFYTFMASKTHSELARRGKNKEGRDSLRQIGLALLVSRHSRLPFHYREYPGNCHDSKVFSTLLAELVGAMRASGNHDLTLVIDKGMNSPDNFKVIDDISDVHFITTYSPSHAESLAMASRKKFTFVKTPHNIALQENNQFEDCITVWRTQGEYWGRERTVLVTYNPRTARKQQYSLDQKLLKIQLELFEMRAKVNAGARDWKNEGDVRRRYANFCDELYMPDDHFELHFKSLHGKLTMSFNKNFHRIKKYTEKFGKNILITDREDWSTEEIVQAALDRYLVEEAFRQSKDDDLVTMAPIRHWTDTTIRCHFFCCVIALTYLRILELILKEKGFEITADRCMDIMRKLRSCVYWSDQKTMKINRKIEVPTPEQAAILQVFGFQIVDGVLQKT